jgi:glycosyltransferase involved in cell wall biosynthesis
MYQKCNRGGFYVSISDADRHPALDYIATIHHGIDMRAFPVRHAPRDYLLFFGRIHPDKGTARAIEVARAATMPMIIAGIVQDEEYFERCVRPHIDGERVHFIGTVGPERRAEVLGGARALLHLIEFDEPFGFSVVEAMACGTPVIAHGRGSMPEIIRHGENGYLVTSVEQSLEAIHAAENINPAAVRASVEHRFDAGRMVDEYIAVYHRVLDQHALRREGAR